MSARIILFIVFLSLLGVVVSFKNYRQYHSEERSLKIASLDAPTVEEKLAKEGLDNKKTIKPKEWKLVLDTPQLKSGEQIFLVKGQCLKCHGERGQGVEAEEGPLLAGQHEWYVYDQLIAFKSGQRKNEKMLPYIQNLTDQDFKDVAAYIEKLRIVE